MEHTTTHRAVVNKVSLYRESTTLTPEKINSSIDIEKFTRQLYDSSLTIFESFYIVLLNNQNLTIGFVELSKGGLTGTLVDVRLVVKYAIESLATSIILVHNHPSGTLTPSQADKKLTSKLKQSLEVFDIKILDHIILTETNYLSFADEGIL